MAYLRQYQMQGDPFLGNLIRGAINLGKGAFGAVTGIHIGAPRLPAVLPGGGGLAAGMGAALGKVGKVAGKFPGGKKGAAIAGGALLGGGLLGAGGAEIAAMMHHKKYRRMNVCNVRALRRSMR